MPHPQIDHRTQRDSHIGGELGEAIIEEERLRRFESLLKTRRIGKPEKSANEYWQEIDSTNTRMAKLARDGACHGTVVMADCQTRGRGRLGRTWVSPPGSGLYLSILLRPERPLAELPVVTLSLGVAAARAVFAVCGLQIGLKWVNDLILDGRKTGGILAEMPVTGGNPALVAGIGLNVNLDAADIPEELEAKVTSLSQHCTTTIDTIELAVELCYQIEEIFEKVEKGMDAEILDEWKSLSVTLGKEIVCLSGNNTIEGTAYDLSPAGALIVRTESGTRELHAGEISIRNKDGSYC
ncbi:MAG: biotin--[acetyl-CoA-carboxylase] ligase [Candidatus Melainabacteria bacterium]|nr:biotin--[acetyl-CoA-carboxylase] ligase [Candidatus Melainabacteria bacterium]